MLTSWAPEEFCEPVNAHCPQPTRPPVNTLAFSPHVVKNRDLESGKRGTGKDSENAGTVMH